MSDLISRQDALAEFIDDRDVFDIMESIEELPSADRPTVDKEYLIDLIQEAVYDGEACAKLIDLVDRPTGKWVFDECGYFHCEVCGRKPNDQNTTTDYCPHCGARLGGDTE